MSEDEASTSKLQTLLESMYDDLTEAAISAKKIYYESKVPQNYFTHEFKLRFEAQNLLKIKRISLEKLLELWIEKKDLGIDPEGIIDIYDLCAKLGNLLVRLQ